MYVFILKMNITICDKEINQNFIDNLDRSKNYTFTNCKVKPISTELKLKFFDCEFIRDNFEINDFTLRLSGALFMFLFGAATESNFMKIYAFSAFISYIFKGLCQIWLDYVHNCSLIKKSNIKLD